MSPKEKAIAVVKRRAPERAITWPDDFDRLLGFRGWPFRRLGFPSLFADDWPFRRFPSLFRDEEWAPAIEVARQDGTLVVRADVPGVKPEEIEVAVEGNSLAIRGRREEKQERKEKGYYYSERSTGEFCRMVLLPEGADTTRVEASYQEGVLEVKVPTPETPKSKRVEVKVGSGKESKQS